MQSDIVSGIDQVRPPTNAICPRGTGPRSRVCFILFVFLLSGCVVCLQALNWTGLFTESDAFGCNAPGFSFPPSGLGQKVFSSITQAVAAVITGQPGPADITDLKFCVPPAFLPVDQGFLPVSSNNIHRVKHTRGDRPYFICLLY